MMDLYVEALERIDLELPPDPTIIGRAWERFERIVEVTMEIARREMAESAS